MKLKNITPKPLQCLIGSCPAIYLTDRGTAVVIGRRLDSAIVSELLPGKVGIQEEAIEIPRELLNNLASLEAE